MSRPSSFQRFLVELRRRHVPQTVAVYLVAAWAAIEFADVVVPNLDGPPWVITAVIIASALGLPVVLILAWIFDWGPEGLHRTEAEEHAEVGQGSRPWLAAVAVLSVAIGTGIVVAALLAGRGDAGERDAGVAEAAGDEETSAQHRPHALVPPDGPVNADSIRSRVLRDLAEFEGLQELDRLGEFGRIGEGSGSIEELVELAREVAEESGRAVFVQEPREWRTGPTTPVVLPEGDTLIVQGVASDTAGVRSVSLDGATIAEGDGSRTLRFSGSLVGRGSAGTRPVNITVETVDGREIVRERQIVQVPRQPSDRR